MKKKVAKSYTLNLPKTYNFFYQKPTKVFDIYKIGKHLRRRIRCIIWKQWKIPKCRINNLIKLGCGKEQAKVISFSRKGYWNSSLYISIFITNKRLQKRGLVSPLDHYLKLHTAI